MTKLTVAARNFANAPKIIFILSLETNVQTRNFIAVRFTVYVIRKYAVTDPNRPLTNTNTRQLTIRIYTYYNTYDNLCLNLL